MQGSYNELRNLFNKGLEKSDLCLMSTDETILEEFSRVGSVAINGTL
jgi:hypothetical protein